jgi:hypothetical protein
VNELKRCIRCGAWIRWVITENGKRMPLDPKPRPDGNVVPRRAPTGGAWVAHVLGGAEMPAQERAFVSHFTTCPNAGAFRVRRPGSKPAPAGPRCTVCQNPMNPADAADEGVSTHATCDPAAHRPRRTP